MAAQGVNVNCNPEGIPNISATTFRIYWRACVDLNSIEVVNRPIVWCKFGNCCEEVYILCIDATGGVEVVSHWSQPLTLDRCQDEPGRECIPAMCD